MERYPTDRRYTRDHEWALLEWDTARIGITAHAQEALGEVVYVELPAVGDPIAQGKAFGVVESTKAVSELFAPLSGKVLEVNHALLESPEQINADPHVRGWMIRVRVCTPSEMTSLLDAAAYEEYVQSANH